MSRILAKFTVDSAAAAELKRLGLTTKEAAAEYVSALIVESGARVRAAEEKARQAKADEYEAIRGMINAQLELKTFGLDIEETEAGSGQWQVKQTKVTVNRDTYREKTTETIAVVAGPYSAKYVAVQNAIKIATELYWEMKTKLERMQERAERNTWTDDAS